MTLPSSEGLSPRLILPSAAALSSLPESVHISGASQLPPRAPEPPSCSDQFSLTPVGPLTTKRSTRPVPGGPWASRPTPSASRPAPTLLPWRSIKTDQVSVQHGLTRGAEGSPARAGPREVLTHAGRRKTALPPVPAHIPEPGFSFISSAAEAMHTHQTTPQSAQGSQELSLRSQS